MKNRVSDRARPTWLPTVLRACEAFVSGAMTDRDSRALVEDLLAETDRMYPAEPVQQRELLWQFAGEVNGAFTLPRPGESETVSAKAVVRAWLPYLRDGEDAWRRAVDSGSWPVPRDESAAPKRKSG